MDRYGIYFWIVFSALILFVLWIVYILNKKSSRKHLNFNSEKELLYMFRGMNPQEFEEETARMFNRYGYKTKVVGKSHDHGIDVIAYRDGKKYLIQCKKYLTSKAGVVDVRSFYGAIHRDNADGGFFITSNEFTEEALDEFRDNKKMKLINSSELIKFYVNSIKK